MKAAERYVCVHGHFYQPPRENPWLEAIEEQDSASPWHDWNERITAECYAPNAAARVLDSQNRIIRILNNYSRISFNFGPTLLTWLETCAPNTHEAIVAADALSMERFGGHGSAMAQAYNHIIMPLANFRDKRTQVRWGIADFEFRYRRKPEGLWLPETAVDTESLEILAAEGIAYTVLAPRQAFAMRPKGTKEWTDVRGGGIDPSMPYEVELPSGRTIAVFFYDGPVSQAVAFERLLSNGEHFAGRLLSAFDNRRTRPQLMHIATDGETYGHHHRYGEMALAWALERIETSGLAKLTNYGEFLERHPPTHQARILEATSWSCAHGVERWRSDCGCRTGLAEWNQSFRAPLRKALDDLRDATTLPFERAAERIFIDPWNARDEYIQVILRRSPETIATFFQKNARFPTNVDERRQGLRLMEMQRQAMLMYTSCGWFFDDLSNIETVQVLQYAGRAIELSESLFRDQFEGPFLETLGQAQSNIPEMGDGRRIWERFVTKARVDLPAVTAHHAVSLIHEKSPNTYCYDVQTHDVQTFDDRGAKLILGHTRIENRITLDSERHVFGILHLGDHRIAGGVSSDTQPEARAEVHAEVIRMFRASDVDGAMRLLLHTCDRPIDSLDAVFRDAQRRFVLRLLDSTVAEVLGAQRTLFERYSPLLRRLAPLHSPIPRPLLVAGELVIGADLLYAAREVPPNVQNMRKLLNQAKEQHLQIDRSAITFALGQSVELLAEQMVVRGEDPAAYTNLDQVIDFAASAGFALDLWRTQNVFYGLVHAAYAAVKQQAESGDIVAQRLYTAFQGLADRLRVRLPEPP
jgi:alpha-amylase/alpha-mannosidase (GH57 family)